MMDDGGVGVGGTAGAGVTGSDGTTEGGIGGTGRFAVAGAAAGTDTGVGVVEPVLTGEAVFCGAAWVDASWTAVCTLTRMTCLATMTQSKEYSDLLVVVCITEVISMFW